MRKKITISHFHQRHADSSICLAMIQFLQPPAYYRMHFHTFSFISQHPPAQYHIAGQHAIKQCFQPTGHF
jgi:hypothetical protein